MDEKIARLNQMIEDYNSNYGYTLTKIKDEDDIYDMKYDTEDVMSILGQQVGQLQDIIDYIEYEIETEQIMKTAGGNQMTNYNKGVCGEHCEMEGL